MTETEGEDAFETYTKLCEALKLAVNLAVKDLTPNQEDYVRDRLNDEFRFWK